MLTIGTQCDTNLNMKYFSWDPEKNEKLKAERNISFEEIVFYIERGQVLDILEHPNKKKYPTQFILKTIIPSRKATKHYLRGDD